MILSEILKDEFVQRALAYAEKHHGDQKYGDQPYKTHLLRVMEVLAEETLLEDFNQDPDERDWEISRVFAAAALHDTLEDTDANEWDMLGVFGTYTMQMVHALTKEQDLCRKCAFNRTVAALNSSPWARRIKLCDRIANMEASRKNPGRTLSMYLKEYPAFKELIHAEEDKTYWARLETLFKGHNERAYLQTDAGHRYIGTQFIYAKPFTKDPSLPREGRGDGAAEIIAEDLRRIQGR